MFGKIFKTTKNNLDTFLVVIFIVGIVIVPIIYEADLRIAFDKNPANILTIIGGILVALMAWRSAYLANKTAKEIAFGKQQAFNNQHNWEFAVSILKEFEDNIKFFYSLESRYIFKITGLDIGHEGINKTIKTEVRALVPETKQTSRQALTARTARNRLNDVLEIRGLTLLPIIPDDPKDPSGE